MTLWRRTCLYRQSNLAKFSPTLSSACASFPSPQSQRLRYLARGPRQGPCQDQCPTLEDNDPHPGKHTYLSLSALWSDPPQSRPCLPPRPSHHGCRAPQPVLSGRPIQASVGSRRRGDSPDTGRTTRLLPVHAVLARTSQHVHCSGADHCEAQDCLCGVRGGFVVAVHRVGNSHRL